MRNKNQFAMWKKTLAVIILLLSMVALPIGGLGTSFMIKEGLFVVEPQAYMQNYLVENMEGWGKEILYTYIMNGKVAADLLVEGYSIDYIVLEEEYIRQVGEFIKDSEWYTVYTYERTPGSRFDFNQIDKYAIIMMVPKVKIYPDYISCISFVAEHMQLIKWLLPVMAVSGLILGIGSLAYLFCGAGWSAREQKQTEGVLGFVPTDILLVFLVAILIWIGRKLEFRWILSQDRILFLTIGIFCMLIGLLSLAARIKAGNLWKNCVMYRASGIFLHLFALIKQIINGIPLIWKTVLITFGVCVAELIVCLIFYQYRYYLSNTLTLRFFLLWFLEKLFLCVILFYWMQGLCKLKRAGKELANGNSDYKVDTGIMFGQAKEHGENLNSISEGVKKAVDERMKSEHLKTELITNVSHDIKTPLTSIINYSDLICMEELDNEKIKEYAEVLHRQSGRLKKLIEDLVDASKASTGNVEVNLEPCDVGVLLTQASGEFEQRMLESELNLISKQPNEPVQIMADSKLLWRVFDNLLTNICKYSQKGTRVYLAVEEKENKAIISFRNISEYPLDISVDELMERFVRGDRSRHTEGNGLGLNIAKSLTELQGGNLELFVDGDLFKVLLIFPKHVSFS